MLTTLEANFVTEYQLTGNATQAYKAAGYDVKSPVQARVRAHRLLKKPEIVETLETQQCNIVKQLTTPKITTIVSQPKEIILPTREQYAETAWKRSSDSSTLKEDTKHKYFETTGKVLRYIGANENESRSENIFNVICNDLKISIDSDMPMNQIALEKKSILESMSAQPAQQNNMESQSQNVVDVNSKNISHE